jgi:hypothetical protein
MHPHVHRRRIPGLFDGCTIRVIPRRSACVHARAWSEPSGSRAKASETGADAQPTMTIATVHSRIADVHMLHLFHVHPDQTTAARMQVSAVGCPLPAVGLEHSDGRDRRRRRARQRPPASAWRPDISLETGAQVHRARDDYGVAVVALVYRYPPGRRCAERRARVVCATARRRRRARRSPRHPDVLLRLAVVRGLIGSTVEVFWPPVLLIDLVRELGVGDVLQMVLLVLGGLVVLVLEVVARVALAV